MFDVAGRITIPWHRTVTVNDWMLEHASHSYVAALPTDNRSRLMAALHDIAHDRFPHGTMQIAYDTSLWTAVNVSG